MFLWCDDDSCDGVTGDTLTKFGEWDEHNSIITANNKQISSTGGRRISCQHKGRDIYKHLINMSTRDFNNAATL